MDHWFPLCLYFSSSSSCLIGMPFPLLTAYQSPSPFTFLEKFSQILTEDYSSLPCSSTDIVWMPLPVPQAALHLPSRPFLLSCSWRAVSFPYFYPHPSPRALAAWHSVNVMHSIAQLTLTITRGENRIGWQGWRFL